MNIPIFMSVQYTKEDGFLTPEIQLYNDELNNVLRAGLSNNGWTLPVVTKAELTKIIALGPPTDQPLPNGTMWVVQETPDLPAPQYAEVVVLLDDGSGTGTSALYKLTKSAYP